MEHTLVFLCDVISDVKDICYVFFVFTFDRLFDGLPCSFNFAQSSGLPDVLALLCCLCLARIDTKNT
jgi:hypothetical protein